MGELKRIRAGLYETSDGQYRIVRHGSADLSNIAIWEIEVRYGENWHRCPDPRVYGTTLRDARSALRTFITATQEAQQ